MVMKVVPPADINVRNVDNIQEIVRNVIEPLLENIVLDAIALNIWKLIKLIVLIVVQQVNILLKFKKIIIYNL